MLVKSNQNYVVIQNVGHTLPEVESYVIGGLVATLLMAMFAAPLLTIPRTKYLYGALVVLAPLSVIFRYYVELWWSV